VIHSSSFLRLGFEIVSFLNASAIACYLQDHAKKGKKRTRINESIIKKEHQPAGCGFCPRLADTSTKFER